MTTRSVTVGPKAHLEAATFGCDVTFVGDASEQLFVSITYPRGVVTGSTLVCSPVHADFARNYRAEVLLGRTLAANGVATARLHYRGIGHSWGDPQQMTFATMTHDACTVIQLMRERFNAKQLCFVGSRLGGYVAAAVASEHPRAPLVLWSPVMTSESYLLEAKRALRFASLAGDTRDRSSGSDAATELDRRGLVDVHGYPVRRVLLQSLDHSLPEVLGDTPRPLKIVQFGRGKARPDYASAAEVWGEKGFQVEFDVLGEEVSWWSRGIQEERDAHTRLTAGCVKATADWILGGLRRLSHKE